MARTKLTAGREVVDGSTFVTPTATAGANNLVLLFITSGKVGFFDPPPGFPAATFGGQAMTLVNTVLGGDRRLSCLRLTTTQSTSGAFSITFADDQDYCAWSAVAYSGVDTATPVKQSKVTSAALATTLTLTLPTSARNACAGALIVDQVVSVSPGVGLVEVDEISTDQGPFAQAATLETLDSQPLVENVRWVWPSAANAAALVVEVNIAVESGPPPPTATPHPLEALVRRFEPLMFLHPEEKFFPVNAKRFVESATLWATETPSHVKSTWGEPPGGSFPRRPTATNLAAVRGEPGTFLGSMPAGDVESATSFLELGGWNDAALSHESGVTQNSDNVYSDRDAVAVLYETKLRNSRYWYHAEVFTPSRLDSLARNATPDLRPILAQVPNATLLCYHLFFPAHQQSVQCDGVKGVELASHVGDWQCIAILLQGDGTTDASRYQPRYFGLTGSRPAAGPNGFDAYEFDDDELTVMKVAPWRTGGPGEVANPATTPSGGRLHPHVYVSKGSHSLWATPGDHPVDPYPATALPHDCGDSDSVSLTPPPPTNPNENGSPESVLEGLGVFLLKVLAGAKVGGLGLGPLSLAGGIAAWWSGINELIRASSPPFGAAEPNVDTPKPDSGPASAPQSFVIKPGTIVVDGSTVVDWQVGQGVKVDGRVYDYVVDRDKQVWWPMFNGEGGYKGRWGQRVTDDTLPRRSGPLFPNYPRMFLMALADLKGK